MFIGKSCIANAPLDPILSYQQLKFMWGGTLYFYSLNTGSDDFFLICF